jgi:hypothetical protein
MAGAGNYRRLATAGAQFAVHRRAEREFSAQGNDKIRLKTLR